MLTWLKWIALVLLVVVIIGAPALVGIRPFIGPKVRPLTNRTFEPTPERLERGRYLVSTSRMACLMCHSPLDANGGGLVPVPGRQFSGRSWAPEGLTFVTAPNLTPDPETGIGAVSDDALARAIREGIGRDGRTLFPVMPYQAFRHMTDEDLASIIVYLRAQKPIRHSLTATAVPFPLSRLINGLPEPVEGPVTADLSTPEKRGAYIVEMASCTDCHTTRDAEGNQPSGFEFAGGTAMPFEGRKTVYSANITPGVNGIPYYSEELFVETMRTGKVKARVLDSYMPTALYRNMTDEDLKDVFAYLKTLKPVDHYVDNSMPPTGCPKCGLSHGGGERNKK